MKETITLPPGRFVQGSLTELNDKDWQNKPLTYKSGQKAGQPMKKSHVAVAIPKIAGHTHWAHTEWGAKIWAVGHGSFPNGEAKADSFAWKIDDGDSTKTNKKGRRICDMEGYPGCWIVHAGQPEQLPKTFVADTAAPMGYRDIPAESIGLGDDIGLVIEVDGNGQNGGNAGVYINPRAVFFIKIGPRISRGFNPSSIDMAAYAPQSALPSAQAAQAAAASVPAAPAIPGVPGAPALNLPLPQPGQGTVAVPMAPAAPAPVGVVPSPTFLQPPGAAPAPPGVLAPPPAPPARQMTAKATASYEQYIAAGWNDAALRQHGYMA